MTTRTGNWMLTASGRLYWPADPRAEEVYLEDVAAHLAKLCRYTGACRELYTIAEHGVLVSRLAEQYAREAGGSLAHVRRVALCGLHHDDPEAYINDINRPTKKGPKMEGYAELEALNWAACAARFDLRVDMYPEVHLADRHALFHEASAIMPPMPKEVEEAWGMGLSRPAELHPEWIQCWDWRQARTEFLNRHKELTS